MIYLLIHHPEVISPGNCTHGDDNFNAFFFLANILTKYIKVSHEKISITLYFSLLLFLLLNFYYIVPTYLTTLLQLLKII